MGVISADVVHDISFNNYIEEDKANTIPF